MTTTMTITNGDVIMALMKVAMMIEDQNKEEKENKESSILRYKIFHEPSSGGNVVLSSSHKESMTENLTFCGMLS